MATVELDCAGPSLELEEAGIGIWLDGVEGGKGVRFGEFEGGVGYGGSGMGIGRRGHDSAKRSESQSRGC